MKKLILTTICTLAVAGAAFAQGTVNWVALSPAAFTIETNATVYSPLFGGASTGGGTIGLTATPALGFYYELLYLTTPWAGSQAAVPTTLAALNTWADAGLEATNATASTGKASGYPNNTQATVPWAAGTTDNIVIVGWSANLGTSYSTVLNELNNWTGNYANTIVGPAYFGVSATGFETVGSGNPGATVVNTGNNAQGKPINSLLTQLDLLPVPEPTTIALATLGGASLLLFRRRK